MPQVIRRRPNEAKVNYWELLGTNCREESVAGT